LLFCLALVFGTVGTASAKSVTSSKGGISSSQSGGGYGSVSRSSSSGHSASTDITLEQTATGEGSKFSKSDTNSGIDSDEVAFVSYSGTVKISGSVSGGDGEVTSRASLSASADEDPSADNPDKIWVSTKIQSSVEGQADAGATVKGSASASGKVISSAQWNTGTSRNSLTSVSSGSTSATVNVRGGASGEAKSEISGYAEGNTDGSGGTYEASLASDGVVEGKGDAKSSASGSTKVTASISSKRWQLQEQRKCRREYQRSSKGTVAGDTGEYLAAISAGYGAVGIKEGSDGPAAQIMAGVDFDAANPAFSGSATAGAKGAASTRESSSGVTGTSSLSASSNGQVSATMSQKAPGDASLLAGISSWFGSSPFSRYHALPGRCRPLPRDPGQDDSGDLRRHRGYRFGTGERDDYHESGFGREKFGKDHGEWHGSHICFP